MVAWELAVSHLDIYLLVGGTVALCPSPAMRSYWLHFLNGIKVVVAPTAFNLSPLVHTPFAKD